MRIHLIVLAAGQSIRYGEERENKLIAQVDGKPLFTHIVETLSTIKKQNQRVDDLVVVTSTSEIYDQLRHREGVICVRNPNPERGISSSLQIGMTTVGCLIASKLREQVRRGERWDVDKLHREPHCVVCFVADQPYLQKDTILQFLDAYEKSGKGIGCMCAEGKSGNPCAFSAAYWEELDHLTGDVGGKSVLQAHQEDTFFFQVRDWRELQDIDTKGDI